MKRFQPQGYFAELTRKRHPRLRHALGGARCPGCGRPFLLLLSVDTADGRLAFGVRDGRPERIPLLYCWRCGGGLCYRLNLHGGIDLLEHGLYHPQPEGDDFPYENYPEHFPERPVLLRKVPAGVQEIFSRENAGTLPDKIRHSRRVRRWLVPRHQIGGEAWLQQSGGDPGEPCPLCGRETAFFASIGDENGTRRGFVDNTFVQVVYFLCAPCRVLSAHNECD